MKMFKKIFVLASCATMLMAGSAVANAHCCEYNNVCDTKAYQTQAVQDVLFTSGKIVEVNENMIVVKGEHNIIAAMITDDTYLLNGKNGKAKKLSSFKVGKEVTVYHSPKMTRSIPAQSEAFAVATGIQQAAALFPAGNVRYSPVHPDGSCPPYGTALFRHEPL